MKNILVIGAGYVGLSISVLLATKYSVTLVDNDSDKVDLLKKGSSPIEDELIVEYLSNKSLKISFSESIQGDILGFDLAILALPTNYDEFTKNFDTSIIQNLLYELNNKRFISPIVIKSTIPFGFTKQMNEQFENLKILYSPEFLREGRALQDNLYPSRIIIGGDSEDSKFPMEVFKNVAKNRPECLIMSASEAESVKLFSNTYLALRVAFFNELDSFCLTKDLSSQKVINGISLDPRIGTSYNNPSFGYGGYCLPKDTKQLLTNFEDIPQRLFTAVVESNKTRKEFISNLLIKKNVKVLGIYRLVMKEGSDNIRESAVLDIIEKVSKSGIKVIIYEPLVKEFDSFKIINSFTEFSALSDIIVANRIDSKLEGISSKVFSRDIFRNN